ncbi:MAG: hypothetical protein CL912_30820 [Deltaproteobacteria bacterium]|nr:hypothetical protein [Deltaproteobacteria bacterium]
MDKYEGGCVEKGSRSKCYLPKLQTLTKREDPMDNQYRYDLVDFLEDPFCDYSPGFGDSQKRQVQNASIDSRE